MIRLPMFINHFISTDQGKELMAQHKEAFPDLHALIEQHQGLHAQVIKQLNSQKENE